MSEPKKGKWKKLRDQDKWVFVDAQILAWRKRRREEAKRIEAEEKQMLDTWVDKHRRDLFDRKLFSSE